MKHPLIIWLILFLLVTALLAAGWTERLCNIIDGLNASSDSPQMLAASSGSPASAQIALIHTAPRRSGQHLRRPAPVRQWGWRTGYPHRHSGQPVGRVTAQRLTRGGPLPG